MIYQVSAIGFVLLVGLAQACTGQPVSPLATRDIETNLKASDEATLVAAVAAIESLVDTSPETVAGEFQKWQKPLMDARQYGLLVRVTLVAMVHHPQASSVVGNAAWARLEALLALRAGDGEVLAAAKAYYNVAPLDRTDVAIALVAGALEQARLGEPGVAMKFRAEQLAGAAAPVSPGADTPPYIARANGATVAGVMATIKVDPSLYEEAIAARANDESYAGLMGRGNLLLLADRATEAKECFRRAAEMESTRGKDLLAAIEGVARAIRAEDGHVGRANAFVRALQSTEP